MRVEYRITEDDYARAMWLNWMHKFPRAGTALAVILALLVLSEWWLPPDVAPIVTGVVIAYLVMLAILPGAAFFLVPLAARRSYRNYKAIHEPMAVELCDDGLQFSSINGESRLAWRLIFRWHQSDRFVLIYMMPRLFYIVPKSIAQQGFDISLLLQRLAERVGPER